jgi:hypothetical protein
MPSLHILSLGCVRTQQTTDQTFLRFRVGGRTVRDTDARRFDDGTSIVMTERVDFGLNEEVEVQVREQDRSGSDQLGSFRVDRAWRNLGEWQQQVAWRHAHYVVTFEVTEDAVRPLEYTIELVGLECRDAQQATDRPYLEINGERVWGPTSMGTRDTRTFSVTRPFHRNVMVDLWEEDLTGPDHFGKMTLLLPTVQEQVAGGARSYTFRADRGIGGDARYVLRYDLRH